jgi:hypothetical protein
VYHSLTDLAEGTYKVWRMLHWHSIKPNR